MTRPVGPLRDYAAVLSDLDGTLVDSAAPVRRAWTAFARRHGLDPDEAVRSAQGKPARETVRRLVRDGDVEHEAALLAAAEMSDTRGIVALPGARALLESPLCVAIVTSGWEALARRRLAAAGLAAPEVLVTADDVARGKPDPECYRLAAARLGVDPAACVVLEDAPAGVRAGRAAGAQVIAVTTERSADELVEADLVVADLAALDLA